MQSPGHPALQKLRDLAARYRGFPINLATCYMEKSTRSAQTFKTVI